MKRIALFQFHKDWDVCANRLRLLRRFNPGVEVYGLFGGEEGDLVRARGISSDSDGIWHLAGRDARWKWQNTDLCVREWHHKVGRHIAFDVVHVVQWDLLLFDSLENLFARIPPNALGLTGLTSIAAIADRWHWTLNEPHKTELIRLREFVAERHGAKPPDQACLGPGYSLPRAFLDRYAAIDVPELGHDELRLPLFARILGFPIADTGFYPLWFDVEGERLFNANSDEIEEAMIRSELMRPGGRRVFHPFRRSFEGPEVEALLAGTRLEVAG